MTNFFLEELRKIYGDGRVIHDPQFVGECCYGSLGDLRVKRGSQKTSLQISTHT